METPWCFTPSLSFKGQGYVILCLTFPWLWTLGATAAAAGSPEPSPPIHPSTTLWTTPTTSSSSSSSPQSPLPSSDIPIPNITSSPFHSPASDPPPTANVQRGILPTSVSRSKDSTSTHGVVVESDGGLFSTRKSVLVSSGSGETTLQGSAFVSPSVLTHRTSASLGIGVSVRNSFETGGRESTATTTALGDFFSVSVVPVNSVTSSLRGSGGSSDLPEEELVDSGTFVSHVPFSTAQSDFSATVTTSPLPESSDGDFVPSSVSGQHLSSSKNAIFQTSGDVVEETPTTTTAIFPGASSVMLDMNTTQSSAVFQPDSGETTSSLLSSTPEVSSPGSVGGNGSCAETERGCVEYQREGEEEEEERRIKIIIGVACGAILLVVILGVFIGCVLKRRGKMPSGSKIDLSSYWDDSVTLSYINGHVDIPKDSADEMISLDNDSFLNSLDSMSFTNTWTSDTSKHTNF